MRSISIPVNPVPDEATQRALKVVQSYINDMPVPSVTGSTDAEKLASLITALVSLKVIKEG